MPLCSTRCMRLAELWIENVPYCIECADLWLERIIAVEMVPKMRELFPSLWEVR